MKNPWKTLSSEVKYQNPWIKVVENKVIHPGGKEGIYADIQMLPGVLVLPVAADGKVYLHKEFRYLIDTEVWATPGGVIKPGQTAESVAHEELREEIGLLAGKLTRLGKYYFAAGHESSYATVFLASELTEIPEAEKYQSGDEVFGPTQKFSVPELKAMIASNEIDSAYLLCALSMYFAKYNL